MDIKAKFISFIAQAVKNYKYKPATAAGLGVAVRVVTSVMTEQELAEPSFPLGKLDEIGDRIYTKYGDQYKADSVMTYKSRIRRLAGDYEKYGKDAKSMASWSPVSAQRNRPQKGKKTQSTSEKQHSVDAESSVIKTAEDELKQHDKPQRTAEEIRLLLADNRTISFRYPSDLSPAEAEKIGNVLKSIAALNE